MMFFIGHLCHAQAIIDSSSSIKNTSYKKLIIGDIQVSGNKKTKEYIILREVVFKKGDTVIAADLPLLLKQSRDYVYNTTLFVDDSVYVARQTENIVFINVVVKERWYFFPLPYFRLVDRNINQWLVEQHASLERVNYGVKLTHNNLTGRNDKLNIWVIGGYNQQLTLRYELPFFDKTLKHGFSAGITYARQHEVNYTTSLDNKQLFFKYDTAFTRSVTRADIVYSYRPGRKLRFYFRTGFNSEWVADTVMKINPNYYPQGHTHVQYVDFLATLQYFNVDYNAYPTKGFIGQVSLYKRGLDNVNNFWQMAARAYYIKPLFNKTFASVDAAATVKLPYNPYFYNQSIFGYGYFQLRGQEYNVVDGMVGLLSKFTVNREIFNFVVKNPIRSKSHDKIPFKFYLKGYTDIGYAYNPYVSNNLLNNKFMYTYGLGLDVVSIYDFVFRLEYSFNQLGVNGIYLHARD
jgi:outer membrane protein assembly factor BamA